MHWQNHTLIRLAIPFTLGMVGANLFIAHLSAATLFILTCAALAATLLGYRKTQDRPSPAFGIATTALALLIGMTLYTRHHQRIVHRIPTTLATCRGILIQPPQEKARTWALHLQQDNGTRLLLYIGKDPNDNKHENSSPDHITLATLHTGDTILANIRHWQSTQNGGGKFEYYRKHLFRQGIAATAYTPHGQWTAKPSPSTPTRLLPRQLQEKLHHIYNAYGISGETGAIIEAMTIGHKINLSKDTRQAYAHAGVSHVLALSGFHVGIIVLMLQMFTFKPLLHKRWQWVCNLIIIATLWCYALLSGLSPSLVRATLMYTILLLCQSFSRQLLSLNSCALAFLIILCLNPFYLHDIGFQLSFISVAAIGLHAPHLTSSCPSHSPIIRFLWSTLLITIICTCFTAPLVAHHFGSIPLLSVISNLAITPFVYLLMWTSTLWWLFLWCTPIHTHLTDLLNWTATAMNSIVEPISSLPCATIEWQPNVPTTLICYILLFTITHFILKRYDTK